MRKPSRTRNLGPGVGISRMAPNVDSLFTNATRNDSHTDTVLQIQLCSIRRMVSHAIDRNIELQASCNVLRKLSHFLRGANHCKPTRQTRGKTEEFTQVVGIMGTSRALAGATAFTISMLWPTLLRQSVPGLISLLSVGNLVAVNFCQS
uniref:Uncharacterized protein n=1 Tax=Babesia bovis TaxID=5865 RepID=A7AVP5_BABBO|eukprot:XP_001609439.1 hypothetical protein [Babesia bovis T2Bo]